MPDYPSLSKEEKKWRAESDARTIAESFAIMADPERLKAAQAAAEDMLKDQVEQAEGMRKVAKGDFSYPDNKSK